MSVWFTADTHFHHAAMPATGKGWRPFATMDDHDEFLIDSWNAAVRPGDLVFHLGDVGMGNSDRVLETVGLLNGRKQLIAGNHDGVWPGHKDSWKVQPEWLEAFDSVQPFLRYKQFLLCHFPYDGDHTPECRYEHYRPRDAGHWLLHGHVHDAWRVRRRQINIGVDVWDWRPVHLDEIMAIVSP